MDDQYIFKHDLIIRGGTIKQILCILLIGLLSIGFIADLGCADTGNRSIISPMNYKKINSPHNPIYINSDINFTSFNGVVNGTGSIVSPFIIEQWDINASSTDGIHVSNTTLYFIVRNCSVYDGRFGGKTNHGILLDNATNGRIEWNNLTNNYEGICLEKSPYNFIANNTISFNYIGILLHSSSYNYCMHNNVFNNSWHGLAYSCLGFNVIAYNQIYSNQQTGISFSCAGTTLMMRNEIWDNFDGFVLEGATNIVKYNNISSNRNDGIFIQHYYDTEIMFNNITMNIRYGVYVLPDTNYTKMHHNNFKGNNGAGDIYDPIHVQVRDESLKTRWNLSNEGNYWSDWVSPDDDHNGIVDQPYLINSSTGAKDHYPLTVIVKIPEFCPISLLILMTLCISISVVKFYNKNQ